MSDLYSKRKVLKYCGAVAIAGLAGCSSGGQTRSETDQSATATDRLTVTSTTSTETATATQSPTPTPRPIEDQYQWTSDRYDHQNRAYNPHGGYFAEAPFQEWMVSVEDVFTATPPLISGDSIYIVAERRLVTLDRESGEVTQNVQLEYEAATPDLPGIGATILDGEIFATSVQGGLYGHSVENGNVTLHQEFDAETTTGVTASSISQQVYVGDADGTFHAIDIQRGEEVWQRQFSDKLRGRAAVSPTGVYAGDSSGQVTSIDEETGEQLWTKQLDGGVSAPICIADGTVYIGLDTGTIYALAADSGTVLWKHEGPPRAVWRGMAITEDYLWYVAGEGRTIEGVDLESGVGINHAFMGSVLAPPVAVNGQVFFASTEGTIWCLSEETKKLQWSKQLDGKAWSLAVTGGELFMQRLASQLYRFTPVS